MHISKANEIKKAFAPHLLKRGEERRRLQRQERHNEAYRTQLEQDKVKPLGVLR